METAATMNEPQINRILNLRIQPLTPVAIGNGDSISPFSDYVLRKDKLHLIDQTKLQNLFLTNGRLDKSLLNAFVKAVQEKSLVEKSDFFQAFFDENLPGEKLDSVFKTNSIPAFGIQSPTKISCILKENGRPYLPGSSIKGAIKTALLVDWLLDNPDKLNALFMITIRGDHPEKYEKNWMEMIESKLFGDIDKAAKAGQRMDFTMIKIRDSEPFERVALACFQTTRFRLAPNSKNTDSQNNQPTEAINHHAAGFVRTAFLVAENELEKDFKSESLNYWKTEAAWSELTKKLNRVARISIESEIKAIENQAVEPFKKALLPYKKCLVERLLPNLENAEKEDVAFLRLGSGKTWFDNSFANAREILSSMNDLPKLRKAFQIGNDDGVFPITRRLTNPEMLPLGWVKIQLENSST